MKNSIFHRALALLLVVVTLFSVVPFGSITASAASDKTTASASVSSVSINSSKYYIAKKNTPVRSSTGVISATLATLAKDSVVEVAGSSGNYYKVSYNIDGKNKTYYVKKADLKKAPTSMKATFCYTTSDAPLRSAPCEEGKKITTASKGTALRVIGRPVVNKYGHTWYAVLTGSNQLAYVYAPRIKTVSKITLNITGYKFVETGSKVKFTYSVSPSAIKNVTWSSSNRSIAPIDISGAVKAVAGGTVNITASIANIISVSIRDVNSYLNMKPYFQTRNYTCGAAATVAILKYNNPTKFKNTKDTDIFEGTYVYMIRDNLNKYLGAGTYRYNTFTSLSAFEKSIRNSLAQNSPVVARVAFPKKYFNYSSTGHYTCIVGIYSKNGQTWLICVDSYVNRYSSTTYANSKTGIVHVPISEMYSYCSYGGTSGSGRYLVYNP